jgi:hypothetical protein
VVPSHVVEALEIGGSAPSAVWGRFGHEYQFDLDTDAGKLFLEGLLTFLRRRLGALPESPPISGDSLRRRRFVGLGGWMLMDGPT